MTQAEKMAAIIAAVNDFNTSAAVGDTVVEFRTDRTKANPPVFE